FPAATFFRSQPSVLRRSPPITDDYQRSPAFTQCSSGALPATMDDYQRFLKLHRTRTSWCDGALKHKSVFSVLQITCVYYFAKSVMLTCVYSGANLSGCFVLWWRLC